MTRKHPMLERFVQSPILVNDGGIELVESALYYLADSEIGRHQMDSTKAAANDNDFWHANGTSDDPYRPYTVAEGILQIPVQGVLLNRFGYAFGRWATGYTYIEKAVLRGLADAAVKGIAFIIDSPGGEVAGLFELVDKVFQARGTKPLRAFVADHAYSAAYAIASACEDITVTRSGGTGSVGVLTAHMDMSGALEKMGIKVTYVFAGKHKVDGNPTEKLPDVVKARMQERIDRLYSVFVTSVARNRDMDEADVRATEALTYDAEDSIKVKFADKIGAIDEEMVIFQCEVAGEAEDEQMNDTTKAPAATAGSTITQASLDAAVAAARNEGVIAERQRMNDIMGCEEAKDRPAAAKALVESGMDAAMAKTTLGKLPKEAAAAPAYAERATEQSPFEKAMARSPNPEVGSGEVKAKGPKSDDEIADGVFASLGYGPAVSKAH
jgi:signal peptide peptidase SppA